jgi:hypothetical protein
VLSVDITGMRQHCVQCLTEILAEARQTPTGELLCNPCYSALWGPQASEELRSLVRLHTGRHTRNGRISLAPARG